MNKVHPWYARPVLFVADLDRSLHFYLDMLGFRKDWHEDDGKGTVCQVSRADFEIILWQQTARRDKARFFIELNSAQFSELTGELAERAVPTTRTTWGYDCIQVDDPDGNELLFPVQP